ncbi:MAG: GHMP kinase [Fibrobacteria bacterium]|nr:GHMP kinase [Fibrobacteria bacterium]
MMDIDFPVEITTFADIPGGTGLGSSSTFTVGLLNALYALKGQRATKYTLASQAAHIEIDLLKRTMGAQDHFAAAYGNINIFTFKKNGVVMVDPIFYKPENKLKIGNNLLIFYTGIKRDASKILESQNESAVENFQVLTKMKNLVQPLSDTFTQKISAHKFGELLHKNWLLKRELTKKISSSQIDSYYRKAIKAGAIGGKLLGAGGGGFLLFYVPKKYQNAVINSLSDLHYLKFGYDNYGTRITYYDQTVF